MSQSLNKKDLKTLKDTLGKQGISLEQFQEAQSTSSSITDSGILNVDSYCFEDSELVSKLKTEGGWHVGYGVHYNGVGVSKGGDESSESDEEVVNNCEAKEESSGFSSDPPTDDEVQSSSQLKRNSTEEGSDDGQLLYGVASRKAEKPDLYLNKTFTSAPVQLLDSVSQKTTTFDNSEITQTSRFNTKNKRKTSTRDDNRNGYQMIEMEESIDKNNATDRENMNQELQGSSSSSGLWSNFVINLEDLGRERENDQQEEEKIVIDDEKCSRIPLDQDKLSQISAAMANFSLPTPPGWENIDDQKLLNFIKSRIS